jgi:hypothetical protein
MTEGHEALGTEVRSADVMIEGQEALGTEVTSANEQMSWGSGGPWNRGHVCK